VPKYSWPADEPLAKTLASLNVLPAIKSDPKVLPHNGHNWRRTAFGTYRCSRCALQSRTPTDVELRCTRILREED
jgi:hypothetical protein